MATTKTPKPTLPTDTAAATPAEEPETIAACITGTETPPAPEPETPAANIGGTAKDNTKPQKPAAKAGQLIAGTEIRPAITDHRVQLVSHIYPDGTCDAIPTMPPCLVIASRVVASMMNQPRYVSTVVGKPEERQAAMSRLVSTALDIADELMQQAGARYCCTIPGDPEPIAAETDNPEA